MEMLPDRIVYTWAKNSANMSGKPQEVFQRKNGTYVYAPKDMYFVLSGYTLMTEAKLIGIVYPDIYPNIPEDALV